MGNSSTKEKGAKGSKAVKTAEKGDAKNSNDVVEFSISPEKRLSEDEASSPQTPQKKQQSSCIDITPARPQKSDFQPTPMISEQNVSKEHLSSSVSEKMEEKSDEAVTNRDKIVMDTPKVAIDPPSLNPLAPVKKLKPLGWEINDGDKAILDAREKETILENKRIELDKKRLKRKMDKQRKKEMKEMEKQRKLKENASKEEIAVEEEQKTAQQLLEDEETKCMECIKQLCSPTISYNLSSDQWAHRKEGIEQIQKFIEENVRGLKQEEQNTILLNFCSITIVLRKFFQDRVAPVFFAAYDCFRCLLNVYGKYLVENQEVCGALQSVLPPLITSMGGESTGTNRRTQRESCRCVLRIARLAEIDGLALILQLLKADTIAFRPRLALLKILIQEFSIDDENARGCRLTVKLAMEICEPALNHADDKVRKASMENIVMIYSIVGNAIRQFICDVKPAMLKALEDKFSEVDQKQNGKDSKRESVQLSQRNNETLSQIQRDKRSKRGKKSENIKGLLNPIVLTKTSSGRGDEFINQLQSHTYSGNAFDELNKKKQDGGRSSDAALMSQTAGCTTSTASKSDTDSGHPERDSPSSPRAESSSDKCEFRKSDNLNRNLFAELADGSYGNGGNTYSGGFTSPHGRPSVESRFHIRD